MPIRTLLLALTALVLAAACVPESEHPLSDPGHPAVDMELIGTWRAETNGDVLFLHFGVGADNITRVLAVELQDDGAVTMDQYLAFPTISAAGRYLNVREIPGPDWAPPRGAFYFFVRYAVTGPDRLELALLDEEAVKTAIAEGNLQGTVTEGRWGDEVRLTDSGENILRWLAQPWGAVLFEPVQAVFYRVAERGRGS